MLTGNLKKFSEIAKHHDAYKKIECTVVLDIFFLNMKRTVYKVTPK